MSDHLFLDPERAGRAARDLTDAGADFLARERDAATRIQALSTARPWGADEAGAAFEARYRQIEAQLLGAAEGLGTHLEGLGETAARAVRRTTATDESNDALLQQTWPA